MSAPYDSALVDAFLAHHWTYRPVDATFMGATGYDHVLPPAGPETLDEELAGLDALYTQICATEEPADAGDRMDRRMMLAEIEIQRLAAQQRPRLSNPAWFSSEGAFGIISLLLPQSAPCDQAAVQSRLEALPAFLEQGRARLENKPVPQSWAERARGECAAMAAFLRDDLRLHDAYLDIWQVAADAAAVAFEAFASTLDGLPDADPTCGEAYLAAVMQTQHGLDLSPTDAVKRAGAAFDRMGTELEEMAAAIDPKRSWQDIVAGLSANHPDDADGVMALYKRLDADARAAAPGLVTPEREYGLDYRWMAPCFRTVSKALYFLFYRCPPGLNPGEGSVYWVTPPGDDEAAFLAANNVATVKTIHAVHHGSVGHHTQNARARAASSRLARIAGTDCAMGIAFLGAGTLIEGWACYVEDLLMEAKDFYSPQEKLLLKQFERRNAASVLVDIKLHLGEWSMEEAVAFYRDEAGFAPARVRGEVVRNSMFPGSRLMYWLGVEGIKAMRERATGSTEAFHDTLLSYGHLPLAWIGEDMKRKGYLTA